VFLNEWIIYSQIRWYREQDSSFYKGRVFFNVQEETVTVTICKPDVLFWHAVLKKTPLSSDIIKKIQEEKNVLE
jgi:hypothetical protein